MSLNVGGTVGLVVMLCKLFQMVRPQTGKDLWPNCVHDAE